MRISDWSSDVCSSDLRLRPCHVSAQEACREVAAAEWRRDYELEIRGNLPFRKVVGRGHAAEDANDRLLMLRDEEEAVAVVHGEFEQGGGLGFAPWQDSQPADRKSTRLNSSQ